ncbi:calumenin-like isoform X1 [Olea europaea var. sylvestris]|uniref:calumenin-like isoform X1 n=1 Tax=Olea europaea var. sylvestris TaxID=158386 RepID=UPI000C1D0294|nr:calumenin-like isoform X1 [Olea europaea var. sylvestris]XP_022882199.1 calumenin-like isoform X1 [Olea europaea var. sylvestris]XP_022882200.1 calumenin-like isoform X1 [Olea europaea var. sylvestris]
MRIYIKLRALLSAHTLFASNYFYIEISVWIDEKMGRVSVIVYITVAILLLIIVSRSSNKSNHPHRHHRLRIRSNFNLKAEPHRHHEPVAFDPVIADIERRREDKQWEQQFFQIHHPELLIPYETIHPEAPKHESQPEREDFMNAEDYVNDEERFNVTNRLVVLFPKIDVDPVDGYLSENELTEWNLQQSQREVLHRTEREMEVHDKNKDGFVSYAEYEAPSWVKNSDNNSFGYDMGWWKEEHFNASDVDGDGLLNITEFNDFLYPADTKNPKLLQWLCKEEIRERDSDRDGKVNFKEFFHGLFGLVRNYDEEGHNSSHESGDTLEAPAKILFAQLDKDGDGYLSHEELLPIIGKLHPSGRYYAKQQTEYIMQQADSNKDGRLSLKEMIESPYVFYSAVFDDDEDYYGHHDEFR